MALSDQRKSIHPLAGDDWQSIAKRELADQPLEDAVSMLQSWNLHVFMRPATGNSAVEEAKRILPSDVVFLESPR